MNSLREIIQDKEKLEKLISDIKLERDRFLHEAQNKIANMNGQIGLLETLLKEMSDGLD